MTIENRYVRNEHNGSSGKTKVKEEKGKEKKKREGSLRAGAARPKEKGHCERALRARRNDPWYYWI